MTSPATSQAGQFVQACIDTLRWPDAFLGGISGEIGPFYSRGRIPRFFLGGSANGKRVTAVSR